MKSLNEHLQVYQKQLKKGDIKIAYQGLMNFLNDLRIHFKNNHPDFSVAGNIYQGQMDISFFNCSPPSFKKKNLKIVILFMHETLQFDIWLCGANKQIQKKYWEIFKESDWDKYRIPTTTKNVFSIVEHTIVEQANFDDLAKLTLQIDNEAMKFITVIKNDLLL